MGRPSGKNAFIEQVKKLYVEDKLSLGEIREITQRSQQTLSRWLQGEGIIIEPRPRNSNAGRTPEQQATINARVSASRKGKGTGPRKRAASQPSRADVQRQAQPAEPRQCQFCPNTFEPSTAGQVYCSRRCARGADAARKSARNQETYAANPKRCPCGAAISYELRHSAKYCGPECRKEYGRYREKDPENYLTFSCEACGTEITRLKGYSPYNKYCSNDCARRHTKVKKHILVDDAVVLDSNYEVLLWGLCSVAKVSIQRFERQEGVAWNDGGWYAPDFLVKWKGRQVAVETKGWVDDRDQKRWAAFRAAKDVPLVVLTRDALWPPPASREDLLALLGLAG
jgi:hypothetical protein